MKFGLAEFKKDTPIIIRRIGYALYTTGIGSLATLTLFPSLESICKCIAIFTFAGGFITNFCGEDKNGNGIPDKFE